MRSTLRCLLACLLCVLLPSVGYAGPIGDSLRDLPARQGASAPAKSRQGVWVGGIVLTVVGGGMMIGGQSRQRNAEPGCGGLGAFGGCGGREPNHALVGAGAAVVGVGVIMILLGRTRPAPQIVATPRKFAIQHTVKF